MEEKSVQIKTVVFVQGQVKVVLRNRFLAKGNNVEKNERFYVLAE